MTGMTYAKYLHLREILSLQNPLTPAGQRDIADSERLFIVVHQASEVLLSQALVDLRHIEANECDPVCYTHRVQRAISVIGALEGQLKLLHEALRPSEFHAFRDRFGTASGLQSAQFHELFAISGRLSDEGLRDAVVRWRTTHLEMVEYMLGEMPGSGNTSGTRFLAHRIAASCPYQAAS